jgi:hypothetical protein
MPTIGFNNCRTIRGNHHNRALFRATAPYTRVFRAGHRSFSSNLTTPHIGGYKLYGSGYCRSLARCPPGIDTKLDAMDRAEPFQGVIFWLANPPAVYQI